MAKKSTETAAGMDIVTVNDLMEQLGVCYNTAAEKMGNYKRALQKEGRDVSNMAGAITIGDYCHATGITVPELIQWREYQQLLRERERQNQDAIGVRAPSTGGAT
ncbi:MAG: hypothetical protein II896_03875 [Clostridia bacterium]|nr:hypothetical protein [Clostridia bacterium]